LNAQAGRRGAVLVTGASRGMGAEIARKLARRGVPVGINHSSSDADAQALCAAIRAEGGQALALQADLAEPEAITRMFASMDAGFDAPLAGLVNNAAYTGQARRRVDQADATVLRRSFAVNAIAPFLCAREALDRMSRRGGGLGGRIVNVSSIGARTGSAGDFVDYAASKAALDTFTLGLAREVATEGVQVNGVAPGLVDTEIHARAGDAARLQRITAAVPMKRPGTPAEIADVVVWLLLDAPDYLHGATIPVSGGL
jgi:NAD(P)-dependent dehydrogenase (short-subunit alcohol dehydrogenase family)